MLVDANFPIERDFNNGDIEAQIIYDREITNGAQINGQLENNWLLVGREKRNRIARQLQFNTKKIEKNIKVHEFKKKYIKIFV